MMLLGHRDQRRQVGVPEGIDLNVEEHTQLEFTREQALRQLGRALTGMQRVSAQGPPQKILTHLLNRSGMLQEHGDDTYQFIHRTFQDYLAAKELIEDDHVNELLLHADEEAWQDVILLAAGHCGRRELAVLVGGLLDAGDKHGKGTADRTDRHVLAALCAQHSAWLDGGVRERVRTSTAALFPPADDDQMHTLAQLGQGVLAFFPEPDSVPVDGAIAERAVRLLGLIGGTSAVPVARAWALAHPGLGRVMVDGWDGFPADEFAAEVLCHYSLAGVPITLFDVEQLRALRHLPSVDDLSIGGDLPEADVLEALKGRAMTFLLLDSSNSISDISVLKDSRRSLRQLFLRLGSRRYDLRPLTELSSLTALKLDITQPSPTSLASLSDIPALTMLWLTSPDLQRLSEIPAHPEVTHLNVESRGPLALKGLAAWPALTSLTLTGTSTLKALKKHPGVTSLELAVFPWGDPALDDVRGLTITELTLQAPRRGDHLASLWQMFPSLTRLGLLVSTPNEALDLTPLHSWPSLHVTVSAPATPTLVGAAELGDRLQVHVS
ncbi:NACHT domain-containing protein [Streptomyces cyaneofuscatus]|uniref:NACHT domain-containing protein n=1 Tax=Streptomyces cyaneofuscatus TaxID=66883 RepID=UPI003443554D